MPECGVIRGMETRRDIIGKTEKGIVLLAKIWNNNVGYFVFAEIADIFCGVDKCRLF